jgi:hypothetical protein
MPKSSDRFGVLMNALADSVAEASDADILEEARGEPAEEIRGILMKAVRRAKMRATEAKMTKRNWYQWIELACDILAEGSEADPAALSALLEMRSALRCLSERERRALGDAIDCAIDGGALEGRR